MKIQINGSTREVRSELTVAELLEELELRPEQVAVELNQRLVARRLRAETRLSEGDRVELVTLVGGG
jgi:sulfur carrier protein